MHFLPESPRFNLVKGRTEEARATLQKIYRHASPEQVELKLKAVQVSQNSYYYRNSCIAT